MPFLLNYFFQKLDVNTFYFLVLDILKKVYKEEQMIAYLDFSHPMFIVLDNSTLTNYYRIL